MATRKAPPETDAEAPVIAQSVANAAEDHEDDEESILSSSMEGKPRTGKELYDALVANGFIGSWKDRTDIGDTLEYARMLRTRANAWLRGE